MLIFHAGFNYSQDGPGNRLVYHMQGCNFCCKWCSNPESMAIRGSGAMFYRPEDIVDEAERSKMMFFDGGGVTFTGGEPTIQYSELLESLKLLKKKNISTAIETNGSHPKLSELTRYVDFLIVDLKHYDNIKHMHYTGWSNKTTIDNIRAISSTGRQLHLRIPLIKNVNNDANGFLKILATIDMTNVTLEVLPYHEYGKCKWEKEYEISDGFLDNIQISEFKKKLLDKGYILKDY